ncbi:hypothetical protein TREMEDRAFT_27933 [Tremella mesenterica DSM 1558]|uniref:uncharacterized protein n=1 Tax=Tremella mesenterica (strain ATCC 24925 / CBS 8224 / DSM 1558 / NBRC 9311 / NRRL Y-6157 / RJB 2259-6 / UBC 559-6) TaxID=578456 RepID=UPI0003F4A329|nr:uncharacterized protein TREMEDRAFT_27933 [Tremella mesenterica DSM 1558]EIW71369.1 hypothetical protein TREMEDRAFT_27933 [Tremella mesenterica DSM 1558]
MYDSPKLAAYHTPDPRGTCHLLRLPDEVLTRIFVKLDRESLTKCHRLCKRLLDLLSTNSSVRLHHTLLCNSLILNPNVFRPTQNLHHVPPSTAYLLDTLRERVTRFRTLASKNRNRLEFAEPEGRLYEYLEGVLLRGVGGSRGSLPTEIAVYDLRKLDEWEDQLETNGLVSDGNEIGMNGGNRGSRTRTGMRLGEEQEEEIEGIRTTHKFPFEIAEFSVDPGSDLLVVVELRPRTVEVGTYTMVFHLLSLSTFEPHPKATRPALEWPIILTKKKISLGFQICDDGLFVLKHNARGGPKDQVCGWQWTTGRLAVTLRAFPNMTFESFVLLTPSSFLIPTIITRLDPISEVADELDNPIDLLWTHHLQLYAFPPFSSIKTTSDNPAPPPHTAVHITTIDLPRFHVDVTENIPPPRLLIRTDPPPRHTFPTHPLGSPSPFVPDPESGVVVVEVQCQLPQEDPHFILFVLKQTLAQYLPAPTSPLLHTAFPRPAPVVTWNTIAPYVRLLGPDLQPASWVCYVYGNRFIYPSLHSNRTSYSLTLFDFDPLRTRKEIYDRRNDPTRRADGEEDGIVLVTAETVLEGKSPLTGQVKTGGMLPYTTVSRPTPADVALIDSERIVTIKVGRAILSALVSSFSLLLSSFPFFACPPPPPTHPYSISLYGEFTYCELKVVEKSQEGRVI